MALDFPINPVDGQVYSSGNLSYQWKISSNTWVAVDSISPIATGAFDKANTANITADAAFARANSANITADAAFAEANGAEFIANTAFARANAANLIANLAFDKANTANVFAVAAFARANTANITADAAFARANAGVLKTGNTMTGNLVMSGANIAFATATNSGIYWSGTTFIHSPAANTLVFGTSLTERMRIGSAGQVGIGTSAPSVPLEISHTTGETFRLTNTTGSERIHMYARRIASTSRIESQNGNLEVFVYDPYPLVFGTNNIERMRIDPSGNVGIGTSSPAATLDIVGSVTDAKANVLSQTLTDGAIISWDASLGRIATVTLGGARSISNATNIRVGTYILRVQQNTSSGGSTLTWGRQYKFTANVAPTLTATTNAVDIFSFVSDGTNMYGAMIPDVRS
jgi:hypothetical protein